MYRIVVLLNTFLMLQESQKIEFEKKGYGLGGVKAKFDVNLGKMPQNKKKYAKHPHH